MLRTSTAHQHSLQRWLLTGLLLLGIGVMSWASSHREAPLISYDPLADNTDVYAFRSPDKPNTVTIIANYIPAQLPYGGPNYYHFGENIRYEIHIDNDAGNAGDEIIYRFMFTRTNEDPSTFFNIRLGLENLKTTYTMQRSMDGGQTFQTIITNGKTPAYNIGPRSIESMVGLGVGSYAELIQEAIMTTSDGESVFCGSADDPFFVDLGAIFDLGDAPRQDGEPRDGLARYNVHSIAVQVPIAMLLKDGVDPQPTNILDPNFVIGVWASASRPAMRTLNDNGAEPDVSGDWVQVSRLGMPLTNEVVIPIGQKDFWNGLSPYDEITETTLDEYFYNPELALYISPGPFAGAVPAFSPLTIQSNSLGSFDFSNGADGLFPLKGNPALDGTALAEDAFGGVLLPGPGKPRSVDLWPIFHTGAPNLPPYQLATGKAGDPLAAGKPFINNFLPNGGDMLRLNMAVPATDRRDDAFSSLGLVQAAVLGLTDPTYANPDLQFIPNMDGFPNGRRLEDDVTRIELQAVSGIVLAAIGLWYDDFDGTNPVTEDLLGVLGYTTGVESNDTPFKDEFPYVAEPWRGTEINRDYLTGMDDNQPGPPPAPNNPSRIYVSNTGTPGICVYQPTMSSFGSTGRFVASGLMAGNGVFVAEDSDLLFQVALDPANVKIYGNSGAVNGNPTPMADFTANGVNSAREIAYDADNDILYIASNTDAAIFVFDNPTGLSGMVDADRVIMLNGEPWGISLDADNDRLFVAKDKTGMFQVYNNVSEANGETMPSVEIAIDGATRTHGIHYSPETDILIVTEIGAASGGAFASDGGLYIFEDASDLVSSGMTMATPSSTIMGDKTQMGNPVDVDMNADSKVIYVAEKTKGGRILLFNASDEGNVAPLLDRAYAGVPEAIYYAQDSDQLFASNASDPGIGIFTNALRTLIAPEVRIDSEQEDGNGIVYDPSTGYIIQLSRADSNIKIFDSEGELISQFTDAGIESGREIAYDMANMRLFIASNSDQKIHVYDNPYSLTGNVSANRVLELNGEPWGISYDMANDRLFVAKDKTDAFQVYNNPGSLDGAVSPDAEISINGATRVHGITYNAELDALVVTEIGAASGGNFDSDGGYFIIENVGDVLAVNPASVDPDRAVIGMNARLGNPVDVAYDGNYVILTEKTGGGSLVFFTASADGDVAPLVVVRYAPIPEALFFDSSVPLLP